VLKSRVVLNAGKAGGIVTRSEAPCARERVCGAWLMHVVPLRRGASFGPGEEGAEQLAPQTSNSSRTGRKVRPCYKTAVYTIVSRWPLLLRTGALILFRGPGATAAPAGFRRYRIALRP